MKQLALRLTAVLFAITLSACSKAPKLQTVLEADEDISTGSQVTLNDRVVGKVVDVGKEGGERVANFVIEDKDSADRMQEGLYRVKGSGKVVLRTDLIEEGAKPLARGARVPVKGEIMVMIEKYSRGSSLIVAGVALVALVIVWLVFRSLVGTAMLVICGVFASIAAQLVTPYTAPHVKSWLDQLGPPPNLTEQVDQAETVQKPEGADKKASDNLVKFGEGTLVKVASKRPSPWLVSWSAVFLIGFIFLNLLLARVSRGWRRAT